MSGDPVQDSPTLEYQPQNRPPSIRPTWTILIMALAALPYIGRYSWRILEAFHPLDVPPWNDLLGNVAAGCLAIGLIATPFNLVFSYICFRRYRGKPSLQTLAAIAALASLWTFISAFLLTMTWK